MTLDDRAPHHAAYTARPLSASLRWGLGWTVVLATLGATAGCVSATPVEDSPDIDHSYDDHYGRCVDALGGMPDAAEHHIDACQVAAAHAFSG